MSAMVCKCGRGCESVWARVCECGRGRVSVGEGVRVWARGGCVSVGEGGV